MASRELARTTLAVCILLVASALPARAAEGEAAQRKEGAVAAARAWLALVDEGKYAESWSAAAELFQNGIPRGQWVQQLEGARTPLGKLVKRDLRSTTSRQSVPGGPDGHYVVIQFATSFANKKSAVETVTPMLDPDGNWRVSGYFIR